MPLLRVLADMVDQSIRLLTGQGATDNARREVDGSSRTMAELEAKLISITSARSGSHPRPRRAA